MTPSDPRPAARQRDPLDRPTVLRAALRLIDARGVADLTMRRLGRELGVEAMTLYHWVPSREALVTGVVDLVVDEVFDDLEARAQPDAAWPEYLRRLAHGVRRMALAHPNVFPLVATRPPAAPWVRPPLRSLRWVEEFLHELMGRGFDEAGAMAAYRGFTHFLLGALLLEVSAQGVLTRLAGLDEHALAAQTEQLRDFPLLQRLAPQLAENHAEQEFDTALAELLDRLAAVPAGAQVDGSRPRA